MRVSFNIQGCFLGAALAFAIGVIAALDEMYGIFLGLFPGTPLFRYIALCVISMLYLFNNDDVIDFLNTPITKTIKKSRMMAFAGFVVVGLVLIIYFKVTDTVAGERAIGANEYLRLIVMFSLSVLCVLLYFIVPRQAGDEDK
jgi:phosphoglycerol transferase MdoB-like AlkP superfamily enzyme